MIVLKELFSSCLFLLNMVLWRYKYIIFYHVALKILSILFCWYHIQDSLLSGIELMRLLLFDSVCIDNYGYFYVCIDVDLVYSGGEIYFQNFGWQWVKSRNGLLTCLNMIFIEFQRHLQLWVVRYWMVGVFVLGAQTFYNLVQK